MEVLELLHVPPVMASESVKELPTQMLVLPVMGEILLTEKPMVTVQPEGLV